MRFDLGDGCEYGTGRRGEWGGSTSVTCVGAVRWLTDEVGVDPARAWIRGGRLVPSTGADGPAKSGDVGAGVDDFGGGRCSRRCFWRPIKSSSRHLDGLISAPYPKDGDVEDG